MPASITAPLNIKRDGPHHGRVWCRACLWESCVQTYREAEAQIERLNGRCPHCHCYRILDCWGGSNA
jgi:hypothetical protein